MIIECRKCGIQYNFDDSLVDGEGVWVRCSHCKNIFFLAKERDESIFLADAIGDHGIDLGQIFDEGEETPGSVKSFTFHRDEESRAEFEEKTIIETIPEDYGAEMTEESAEPVRKEYWSRKKIRAYGVIVIIVLLAVYLWLFPQVIEEILGTASRVFGVEEFSGKTGTKTEMVKVDEREIYFKDIKEHTVKNWIVGDIFVIRGNAVNKNENPVSGIKVRGKILDSSGKILMSREAYGGNILTDEELKNLTQDEIRKELFNSYGRDVSNRDIPFRGSIPFMIVFCNPPEKAREYLIDLAGVNGVVSGE